MDELEDEAKMLRESDSGEEEEKDATEFLAHGDDLDLPSEEEDENDLDVDSDENMDDYYEELGIKGEKDFTEKLYKKTPKVVIKEKKEPSTRSKMIDSLISNTKKDPNYKNIVRVIKIVRQLFTKEVVEEDGKKATENLGKSLNTAEYKKVFEFFVTELPDLLLKLVGIDVRKFA